MSCTELYCMSEHYGNALRSKREQYKKYALGFRKMGFQGFLLLFSTKGSMRRSGSITLGGLSIFLWNTQTFRDLYCIITATASTVGVQTFVLPKAWPTVIYAHYLKTVVHEVHRWYSFINMMVQNVCLAPEKLFYPISCLRFRNTREN